MSRAIQAERPPRKLRASQFSFLQTPHPCGSQSLCLKTDSPFPSTAATTTLTTVTPAACAFVSQKTRSQAQVLSGEWSRAEHSPCSAHSRDFSPRCGQPGSSGRECGPRQTPIPCVPPRKHTEGWQRQASCLSCPLGSWQGRGRQGAKRSWFLARGEAGHEDLCLSLFSWPGAACLELRCGKHSPSAGEETCLLSERAAKHSPGELQRVRSWVSGHIGVLLLPRAASQGHARLSVSHIWELPLISGAPPV